VYLEVADGVGLHGKHIGTGADHQVLAGSPATADQGEGAVGSRLD
jgi:hypothetical protein